MYLWKTKNEQITTKNLLKLSPAFTPLALFIKNRKKYKKFIPVPNIHNNTISASFDYVTKYSTYKPLPLLLNAAEGILLPLIIIFIHYINIRVKRQGNF